MAMFGMVENQWEWQYNLWELTVKVSALKTMISIIGPLFIIFVAVYNISPWPYLYNYYSV